VNLAVEAEGSLSLGRHASIEPRGAVLYGSKTLAADGASGIAGEETGMSSPPDRVLWSERTTGILLGQALLPLFAATLFLSAALLFAVQPMLSKMVLPQLGGTPSVWNTCLCFFQATLLLGYLYAHLSASKLAHSWGCMFWF